MSQYYKKLRELNDIIKSKSINEAELESKELKTSEKTQENILSKASDLEDQKLEVEPELEETNELDPLGDADYMSDEETADEGFGGIELDPERNKKLKLFELLEDLLNNIRSFYNVLNDIKIDLLDNIKYKAVKEIKRKSEHLENKIKNYLIGDFSEDTYEKTLYNYMLLRREEALVLRYLREILDLKDEEEIEI